MPEKKQRYTEIDGPGIDPNDFVKLYLKESLTQLSDMTDTCYKMLQQIVILEANVHTLLNTITPEKNG